MKTTATLAFLLESFFTQRLMNQRQASPHTISSYRDTFRLLLQFTQRRLNKPPSQLTFEEIDAPLVAAFQIYLDANLTLKEEILAKTKPHTTENLADIRPMTNCWPFYNIFNHNQTMPGEPSAFAREPLH